MYGPGTPVVSRRALLAGATALLLSTACRVGDHDVPKASASSLVPDYPNNDLLVDPGWLEERLDDARIRLLDLSELPGYRRGHIPRARHIWWQDTIEVNNPVYGMLAGPDSRQEIAREAGIGPESTVVCYDDLGGIHAARLVWMLRYMGCEPVHLLNGGFDGWRAIDGDITRNEPDIPESDGIPDARDESINAHADDILARLDEPGLAILDTRTESERDETWRGRLREGQIPNSRWLPRDNFLQDGPIPALVSASELRERLTGAGVDLDQTNEVIVYGLHATLASLPWLALTSLSGPHVRLYDGSWSEWGSRDDLPVEDVG